MKPLPFIMQYVRRYKYRYIAGILTLFAVDAASVFIPKLTGIITDGLTARSITWSSYLSSWDLSDWSSACSRPFFVALFSFWNRTYYRA